MSVPSERPDAGIPTLTEVLVPGEDVPAGAVQVAAVDAAAAEPTAPAVTPVVAEAPVVTVQPVAPAPVVTVPQAQASVQASAAPAARPVIDGALLAERVGARLSSQLSEEVATLVEQRCQEVLMDHTVWLVQTIGKQVAEALQADLPERIRQAVAEELSRQARQQ